MGLLSEKQHALAIPCMVQGWFRDYLHAQCSRVDDCKESGQILSTIIQVKTCEGL